MKQAALLVIFLIIGIVIGVGLTARLAGIDLTSRFTGVDLRGASFTSNPQEAARQKLAAQGISFGPGEFLSVVKLGNTQLVELFLRGGMTPNVIERDKNALIIAAENGHTEMVKVLLDNGADANYHDSLSPWTALVGAAAHCKVPAFKLLFARGSAAESLTYALSEATQYHCPEIATILRQAGVK